MRDQLGRPLQDLRISITDRCNFRCTYCMPAHHQVFLSKDDLLTFEEITRLAQILVELGIQKIRLTGGEPLLRAGIENLVEKLVQIEGLHDLAMITNGYLLPRKAQALKAAGLHRLTISLDSLDNAVFRHMNGGLANVEQVLAGIAAAEQAGFAPLKINVVVQRGVNDHTLVNLAHYFKERGHILRFIEYMDAGTLNNWRMESVVPAHEILARIDAVLPLEPVEASYLGEVATRYRYRDGSGEIGVIASVTQPFCGNCTRLRLSANGQLYTCLFAKVGLNLRGLLRSGISDDKLKAHLAKHWQQRTDRYSELRTAQPTQEKIEMHYIGG
ncbi:MAG: GTP 3',8-cyclase MoaA [Anaerolineae bacterium]|nr:MAG: GTP 3',8-cyclase MoaA [Anaerolineae bacterium]